MRVDCFFASDNIYYRKQGNNKEFKEFKKFKEVYFELKNYKIPIFLNCHDCLLSNKSNLNQKEEKV